MRKNEKILDIVVTDMNYNNVATKFRYTTTRISGMLVEQLISANMLMF